jgi:hypothetical protein
LYLLKATNSSTRATFDATLGSVIGSVNLIGTAGAGLIYEIYGPTALFQVIFVLNLVSVLIYAALVVSMSKHEGCTSSSPHLSRNLSGEESMMDGTPPVTKREKSD